MQPSQPRKLTPEQLALYNGAGGQPIYVAYQGKIYDLTSAFTWRNGYHQLFHRPGSDLTEAMAEAPHGAEFLKRFPVVGVLEK
jgi:predicted heme/steroid binding protein